MPSEPARLFLLAGEPSGDRIAADLVRRLRERVPLSLSGVGGEALEAEGLASLYPMRDLSVMGFADVAKRLPLLLWRARQTVAAVLRSKPDIVVLVDAQVFSTTVARRLRRRGFAGPVLLYVAPAVWAWRPERAPSLKPLFDEILAVLPFEPEVMARLGGPPASYVGHPALDRFAFRPTVPERGPLLLLPGSRRGELNRMLEMFGALARALQDHPRVSALVLPTPLALQSQVAARVATWSVPVELVSQEAEKQAAFAAAVGAVAKTGTVTLELALAGVPMVTTYVADAGQAKRFARYDVKFVALPNIILDRPIVPELLFTTPEPETLIAETRRLLDGSAVAETQVAGFAELRRLMEDGAPQAPRTDPAERVLARLPKAQRSTIET